MAPSLEARTKAAILLLILRHIDEHLANYPSRPILDRHAQDALLRIIDNAYYLPQNSPLYRGWRYNADTVRPMFAGNMNARGRLRAGVNLDLGRRAVDEVFARGSRILDPTWLAQQREIAGGMEMERRPTSSPPVERAAPVAQPSPGPPEPDDPSDLSYTSRGGRRKSKQAAVKPISKSAGTKSTKAVVKPVMKSTKAFPNLGQKTSKAKDSKVAREQGVPEVARPRVVEDAFKDEDNPIEDREDRRDVVERPLDNDDNEQQQKAKKSMAKERRRSQGAGGTDRGSQRKRSRDDDDEDQEGESRQLAKRQRMSVEPDSAEKPGNDRGFQNGINEEWRPELEESDTMFDENTAPALLSTREALQNLERGVRNEILQFFESTDRQGSLGTTTPQLAALYASILDAVVPPDGSGGAYREALTRLLSSFLSESIVGTDVPGVVANNGSGFDDHADEELEDGALKEEDFEDE